MRTHGFGGGYSAQTNWKQNNQNTPAPEAPVQGKDWKNWKGGGGDQFQSSFDVSQQGNNSPWQGKWGDRGGHGWHHGQGGSPFKAEGAPSPAPVPAVPAPGPAAATPAPGPSSSGSTNGTPSASPTPSSSSAGGGLFPGGKEGLGVNDTSSNGDGSNLGSTKASWYYNWSPNASGKVNDPNATFVPMIWGKGNMNDKDLEAAKNSKSPMILTFNEPDLGSQGNMSVDEALGYWDKLEATGKKLSSPAITNGPDGAKWLDEFMTKAKAQGKQVDSISLHWYGSSAQPTDEKVASLKSYIEGIHKKYPDKPINLTEFGVDASGLTAGKDQAFLTGAEKMLNGLDYVQMYAPYGTGDIHGN